VNEAVVEEWVAETTAFDRVRAVADATTEPQPTSVVADRARVSDPTARKYLDTMAESGRVRAIETGNGTRYMRSPQAMAMERIASIHREHTRDEIRSAIKRFEEELSALRDTYEVSDVDDLVVSLDAEDDGWADVSRWQRVEENLKITRAALSLYDFDPDDSRTAATRYSERSHSTDGERGAFEFESGESTA
jgi:DNA-binding Lrp family transcriptional regulator